MLSIHFLPRGGGDVHPPTIQDKRFSGQYPYARPLRTGWTRNPTGDWVACAEDPQRWEVFCEQCGNTDGPADDQPDPARELRGPYAPKHKAEHVVKRHFDDTSPQREA